MLGLILNSEALGVRRLSPREFEVDGGPAGDQATPQIVRVPFGVRISSKTHRIVRKRREGGDAVIAEPKSNGHEIQISPLPQRTVTVRPPGLVRGANVQLTVATTDMELLQAQEVVARSHYLHAPHRGIFIIARFENPEDQARLRELAAQPDSAQGGNEVLDAWSSAWTDVPGRAVGVAVLDRLMHGNPLLRREIAVQVGLQHWWDAVVAAPVKGLRSRIVHRLGLAWCSRFAIDAPYRNLGLGAHLAEFAQTVAKALMRPEPRFLEVITTVPRPDHARAESADAKRDSDFLKTAGYTLVGEMQRSKALLTMDPTDGIRRPQPGVGRYYFAKLNNGSKNRTADRLFVPLSGEPYAWFESGEKKWELRRNSRQFTGEHVRPGRAVELRYGYGTSKPPLWGTIGRVKHVPSIEAALDVVPYKDVIPTAASCAEAIAIAKEILGEGSSSGYTMFEVVTEKKIMLDPSYLSALYTGTKRTTIRLGRRDFEPGPALIDAGGIVEPVIIEGISMKRIGELTEEEAASDGFETKRDLMKALRKHYGEVGPEEEVTILSFSLANE